MWIETFGVRASGPGGGKFNSRVGLLPRATVVISCTRNSTIGASRPRSGSAIANVMHLAMQEVVVVPVHLYACAPVADQMVGAGKDCCLANGRSREHQNRDRQKRANEDGEQSRLPVVGVDERSRPCKFGPQRRIEDAPIGTDVALEKFFRLIDRLDNIVVDAKNVGLRNEVAQQAGLADRTRDGALKIVPRTWPAKLPDDDFLARIGRTQPVVDRERSLDGSFLGHGLPNRE